MIPVLWVPQRSRGSWDQGIIEELTAGAEFDHAPPVAAPQEMEGAVVVLAGQHCLEHAEVYADQIGKLPWALTVITSDEEALFPVELLPRDEKHVTWGQYHARPEFDRVIPIGAQPGTEQVLADYRAIYSPDARMNAVAFAGQDTHARRHELLDVMKEMACDPKRYGNVTWAATTGFREGLSQDRYLALLAETRIAPCPSGPHSLDSFRLYEALAAGCLPVVEQSTPHGNESGFWSAMFGEMIYDYQYEHGHDLIPIVGGWGYLPEVVERFNAPGIWSERRDAVRHWWHRWRVGLTAEFAATIERLRS